MTAQLGKNIRTYVEDITNPGTYLVINNSQADKFTVNNTPIDVTDKDGMPWMKNIEGGVKSMALDLNGIFTDASTLTLMLGYAMTAGQAIRNFRVVDGLNNTWTGQFHISSIERSGTYNKEDTYAFKLVSANTITFVPHP